jgi:hypothetical protein
VPELPTFEQRLVERFWAKVDKTDDCWIWTGYVDRWTGYGQIGVGGRQNKDWTHRVAYRLMNGPIPDGMTIDHRCRNRVCVNPAHLRAVTMKQNGENLSPAGRGKAGVRGVYWNTTNRGWAAQIRLNGKSTYLGTFDSVEEAGGVALAARLKYYTHSDGR